MTHRTATELLLATPDDLALDDPNEITIVMSAAELRATLEVEVAIAARRDVHTRPTIEMRAVTAA